MIGRTVALAIMSLALTGCQTAGSGPVRGAVRTCLVENSHFDQVLACIKARYAVGQPGGADPHVAAVLAEGERLLAEVNAGRLLDGDARRALSSVVSREIGE